MVTKVTNVSDMDTNEIRDLRLRLGWSQQVFATRLGVGITTLSTWENGKVRPSKMAEARFKAFKHELKRSGELKDG